jgi:hypothetical protein
MKDRLAQFIIGVFSSVSSFHLAFAQTPDTLKQESYGIYMIDNSSIDGVVQVFEKKAGGVQFIITLNGLLPGELYSAALYSGNCAPDQPLVLELETVGDSVPEDPFVSITESDLTFETVTTGDHFVMIYGRELAPPALACGEVGVGANRTDYQQ